MISGKTSSGFAYAIEERALNNYELLEALGELEENTLMISKVMKMLLGESQLQKLKDHLRLENGTVPLDKMADELTDIFRSAEPAKKS